MTAAGLAIGGLAVVLVATTGGSRVVHSTVSIISSSNGSSSGNSSGSQGHPFAVTGTVKTLYPGTTQPIDLTFTNPNNQALNIPLNGVSVTIKVNSGSANSGCSVANFAFVPSTSTASVVVAANSTVTVSPQSISPANWPALKMSDSGNQDACRGVTLSLAYTAGATGS